MTDQKKTELLKTLLVHLNYLQSLLDDTAPVKSNWSKSEILLQMDKLIYLYTVETKQNQPATKSSAN